jgi:hypothetical protein
VRVVELSARKKKLVIEQWHFPIHSPADLSAAAAGVKPAGPGVGIVGVKANRIRRPGFSNAFYFREASFADSLALSGRCYCHREEVERLAAGCEVTRIYGPGLCRCKSERGNNVHPLARDEDPARAHGMENALLGGSGRPWAAPVLKGQMVGNRRVQRSEVGRVVGRPRLKAKAHHTQINIAPSPRNFRFKFQPLAALFMRSVWARGFAPPEDFLQNRSFRGRGGRAGFQLAAQILNHGFELVETE